MPELRAQDFVVFTNQWRLWPDHWHIGEPHATEPSVLGYLWRCDFCQKTMLMLVKYGSSELAGDEIREEVRRALRQEESWVVWPAKAPRELPDEAPPDARSFFREASVAESAGALRGAAGLYRACVEALVDDQENIPDKPLRAKIEALRGRIDDDLLSDLHEARLTGKCGPPRRGRVLIGGGHRHRQPDRGCSAHSVRRARKAPLPSSSPPQSGPPTGPLFSLYGWPLRSFAYLSRWARLAVISAKC